MMKWQDFLVVQWLPQALNLGALVQSLVRELDPSCPRGKNSHASREKKKKILHAVTKMEDPLCQN